jgi:ribosomal-protein-alanine N-acetyltransferase
MINSMLTTDRLVLSPVTKPDAAELHQLWMQPAVRKYLWDDKVAPMSQTQDMIAQSLIAFRENCYGLWVARRKNHEAIIGFTGYWTFFDPPDIQLIYGLASDYWGQGFATEMAQAMVDYGFETYRFAVIRASADPPNVASIAVMKRLGMTFEKQETIDGHDLIFYQIARLANRTAASLT